MSLLSIIGTGAAFLNYRNAKAEYESVKGEIGALEDAVNASIAFRKKKEEEERELKELLQIQINEVNNPEDLKVSTVCKVANLAGRLARGKVQLVISNTGSKTYYVTRPSIMCSVFGKNIINTDVVETKYVVQQDGTVKGEGENFLVPEELRFMIFAIKPGETRVIDFPKQIIYPDAAGEGVMDKLREIICYACNKNIITSCPKVNITSYWDPQEKKRHWDSLETADIVYQWTTDEVPENYVGNPNLNPVIFTGFVKEHMKTAAYLRVPGVLRYCKELSLIGE